MSKVVHFTPVDPKFKKLDVYQLSITYSKQAQLEIQAFVDPEKSC